MSGSRRGQAGRGGVAGRLAPLARARTRDATGTTSGSGWRCFAELEVPTLIVTPDFVPPAVAARTTSAPPPRWARPPSWPRRSACGSRSSFRSRRRSAACLETAMALIAQSASRNAGVCLDVFHYYTGPSKSRTSAYLSPAEPGLGAGLRPERHAARAGRRRRPDLARRGRLPARADHRAPGADRLRRPRLARSAQPHLWQVVADRVADLGHQALCRVLGPLGVERLGRNQEEGPERVVGGDPPTRGGRLPRGAVLRLAGLRLDRARGDAHGTAACCTGATWSLEFALGLVDRAGARDGRRRLSSCT